MTYGINAWENGWGYVWGTYGSILTDSLYAYKLEQYPEGVGNYASFLEANWLGKRTTDCVGLIKGYGWLDPEDMSIGYGTNGMPNYGANQMYYAASASGAIDTIPDIPGLAVWMGKKDLDLESEMSEALIKLYEKYVPAPVREYIDESDEATLAPPKPRRMSKPIAEAKPDTNMEVSE